MQIDDIHIAESERLLIGDNHFDQERLKFIKSLDSCDLLAVPGSGKTTALQAKLYCLSKLRPNSAINGILVLSHTNAAVDEIKKKLSKACPNLFEYPNFVGTIQDFVDSYLAIPYYDIRFSNPISRIDTAICREEFLKCIQSKWIKNDNAWSWYKHNGIELAKNFGIKVSVDGHFIPWDYTRQKEFKVASTKTPKTWEGKEEENRKHILKILCELKMHMFDRGILSYDDCYVLAQTYINRCPRIKSILRKRFKYVFIDETQDLQEHQLEIMDQLFSDDSVCFQRIGDVNQSIFHVGSDTTDCAWNPRKVQTFNNSMRLTSPVASVVDAFMFRRESGQAVIPNGHLVEVAALVERDDAMLHHVLHIAYGRWIVSQFYGEAERTVIQYLVILVAVRQHLVLAHHEAWCTQSQCSTHAIRVEAVAMVKMEGSEDIHLF